MFTWICPQCGREVPPAYNECPDCAGKTTGAQPETAAGIPVPAVQEPVRVAAPPQSKAPPPSEAPPQRVARGVTMPVWLMSVVFAMAFLGLGAAAFFTVRYFGNRSQAAGPPLPGMEQRAAAQVPSSPLQKYVEVVGVRLTEQPGKKPAARFLVINHSEAEIADLAANVNLWARTAKSDEESVGAFSFKLPSLGPNESREITAPLITKLRVYELPDWQNLNAEVQITSPR